MIVVGAMEGSTSANNLLMEDQNYDPSGDLRSYSNNGACKTTVCVELAVHGIRSIGGFGVYSAKHDHGLRE